MKLLPSTSCISMQYSNTHAPIERRSHWNFLIDFYHTLSHALQKQNILIYYDRYDNIISHTSIYSMLWTPPHAFCYRSTDLIGLLSFGGACCCCCRLCPTNNCCCCCCSLADSNNENVIKWIVLKEYLLLMI